MLWARLRAGTHPFGPYPPSGIAAPAVTDLMLAQTLVRNLLANALIFAERRVVLSARADAAGRVRFAVSNDGLPLPPEGAARLAAGRDESITATGGLGLRLCREICAVLGTRLEAAPGKGGGTEFNFMLSTTAGPAGLQL